jgi:hypothetical protein
MKFYRDTESGATYTESEIRMGFYDLEWDIRAGRTFEQYVCDCTDKNGFLEAIETRIGGNECIGYTIDIYHKNGGVTRRDTIKRRLTDGSYGTAAFGKLEIVERIKATAEEMLSKDYSIDEVLYLCLPYHAHKHPTR